MNRLKHTVSKPCALCEYKLSECDPRLKEVFLDLQRVDSEVHISWGWRSDADQMEAVRTGKSRAMPGKSPHNVLKDKKPHSKAIDVFFMGPDIKADWSTDRYKTVYGFLKQDIKTMITWGGHFKAQAGDYGHFELKDWKIET